MPDLPPPGPARDAMVARALGCTMWTDDGCECPDWPHMAADRSSTTDAGAIEALEAWRKAKPKRFYEICTPLDGVDDDAVHGWSVTLYQIGGDTWAETAPTLGDAASAAIIAAAEEGA